VGWTDESRLLHKGCPEQALGTSVIRSSMIIASALGRL
jgi:hypothetical protein